jgi:hypothetical protein
LKVQWFHRRDVEFEDLLLFRQRIEQ